MTKDECIKFVEFNITGDGENYRNCDDESLYLHNNLFSIFAPCFQRSNHLFDYIGQTKYNSRQFIALKNELAQSLDKLLSVSNLDEFKEYVSNIFLGNDLLFDIEEIDPEYQRRWRVYMRRFIQINRGLVKLINKCIEEERTLWVICY